MKYLFPPHLSGHRTNKLFIKIYNQCKYCNIYVTFMIYDRIAARMTRSSITLIRMAIMTLKELKDSSACALAIAALALATTPDMAAASTTPVSSAPVSSGETSACNAYVATWVQQLMSLLPAGNCQMDGEKTWYGGVNVWQGSSPTSNTPSSTYNSYILPSCPHGCGIVSSIGPAPGSSGYCFMTNNPGAPSILVGDVGFYVTCGKLVQ